MGQRGFRGAGALCDQPLLQNAVSYRTPETATHRRISPARESDSGSKTSVPTSILASWTSFSSDLPGEGRVFSSPAGNGLGLYYVRTVAEKHGGSAGVSCADGKIRFWVWLPTTQASSILG